MKFIILAVILCVAFQAAWATSDNEGSDRVETKRVEDKVPEEEEGSSVKTKRSSLFGYGGLNPYAYGYQKNWIASPHSKYFKSVLTPGVALSPGGASVYSYNVNYPRYPVIAKHHPTVLHHHVPVARPAIIPSPVPLVPHRHIIPVAVPSYHRVPVVVHKPVVVPRPVTPVVVSRPVFPLPPVVPAPVPHPAPAFPFGPAFAAPPVAFPPPAFPVPINPVITFNGHPHHHHLIPSTISTPVAPEFAQPGSTIFTNLQSNGWRPIVVTPTPPTTATINRPAVSLLPPVGEQAPAELQQSLEESFPKPGQLYLPPSEQETFQRQEELAQG